MHKQKQFWLVFAVSVCLAAPTHAQVVAAGGRHSLAICADGSVHSWGYNGYGQLGNGTILEQHSGAPVGELSNVKQVAGGLFHSLFLKSDGTVWSCGRNPTGVLGDGTNTDRHSPVQISGLSEIVHIAGGGEHSLFVKRDGTVWACGLNSSRQLGDGTTVSKNVPVQVKNLSGITMAAAGAEFSLFLKSDGTVWACGHNGSGQYGNGDNTTSTNPVQVPGLEGIVSISAGEWHSLFVKNDGTVYSAGRNMYGQLGNGTTVDNNRALQISGLTGIVHAEAGGIHSVFVRDDGVVFSCGLNSGGNNDGQLGDGTRTDRSSPVQVVATWGTHKIVWAEATREHSLYLTASGELWASGRNNYGQLGYGAFTPSNSITPVHARSICATLPLSVSLDIPGPAPKLYPNPFSTQTALNIGYELSNATIALYNALGQQVLRIGNVSGHTIPIARSNLPNGTYFIRLFEENKLLMVEWLLIID